jgi:hypothetical protein
LAFTPFAIAILATLAPDSNVNFTILSFSSTRRNTRCFRADAIALSMHLSWAADHHPSRWADRTLTPKQGWRRLIKLIFAGRNRIIMIRRELPQTSHASPARPVANVRRGFSFVLAAAAADLVLELENVVPWVWDSTAPSGKRCTRR